MLSEYPASVYSHFFSTFTWFSHMYFYYHCLSPPTYSSVQASKAWEIPVVEQHDLTNSNLCSPVNTFCLCLKPAACDLQALGEQRWHCVVCCSALSVSICCLCSPLILLIILYNIVLLLLFLLCIFHPIDFTAGSKCFCPKWSLKRSCCC